MVANNIWMNLKAIKRILDNDELSLEIIVNNKTTDAGEPVIQLEVRHRGCHENPSTR